MCPSCPPLIPAPGAGCEVVVVRWSRCHLLFARIRCQLCIGKTHAIISSLCPSLLPCRGWVGNTGISSGTNCGCLASMFCFCALAMSPGFFVCIYCFVACCFFVPFVVACHVRALPASGTRYSMDVTHYGCSAMIWDQEWDRVAFRYEMSQEAAKLGTFYVVATWCQTLALRPNHDFQTESASIFFRTKFGPRDSQCCSFDSSSERILLSSVDLWSPNSQVRIRASEILVPNSDF